MRYITSIIGKILAFILIGLRPLLGPAECLYNPRCTKYAVEQLHTQPLLKALWNISKRLLSCNPFFKKTIEVSYEENTH